MREGDGEASRVEVNCLSSLFSFPSIQVKSSYLTILVFPSAPGLRLMQLERLLANT